ncbi:TPA: DUF4398 domain-containing protein, partial [bacterium]|nr:DUF4398 domain-containing protein [bacterium]
MELKRILSFVSIFIFFLIMFSVRGIALQVDPEKAGELITEARNSFAIAKKENAEEFAPIEFAKAQMLLQEAETMMSKKQNEKAIDLAFMADIEARIAIAQARYEKAQYRINKIKELQIDTILEIKSNEVEIAKTRQKIAERIALEAQINSEMSSETAENRIQRSQVDLAITKAEMAKKMA